MDCGLPGSSVHGIFPLRILEWVAISYSRGSSWPRKIKPTSLVSPALAGRFFTTAPPGKALLLWWVMIIMYSYYVPGTVPRALHVSCDIGTLSITLILQKRNLMHREVKLLVQGNRTSAQCRDKIHKNIITVLQDCYPHPILPVFPGLQSDLPTSCPVTLPPWATYQSLLPRYHPPAWL